MDSDESIESKLNRTKYLDAIFENGVDSLETLLSHSTYDDIANLRYNYDDISKKYRSQTIRNITPILPIIYVQGCDGLTLLHVLSVKQYFDGLIYDFELDTYGKDKYRQCTCVNNRYKLPSNYPLLGTEKFLQDAVQHYQEPYSQFLAKCGISPQSHQITRLSPAVLNIHLHHCNAGKCTVRDELQFYHKFSLLCRALPDHFFSSLNRTCLYYLNFHYISSPVITHALMNLILSHYPHAINHVDSFDMTALMFTAHLTNPHWAHHLRILMHYGSDILHMNRQRSDVFQYSKPWSRFCLVLYSLGLYGIPYRYLCCRYRIQTDSPLYYIISQMDFTHYIDAFSRFVGLSSSSSPPSLSPPSSSSSPPPSSSSPLITQTHYKTIPICVSSQLVLLAKSNQNSLNNNTATPLIYTHQFQELPINQNCESVYSFNYNYDYELSLFLHQYQHHVSSPCKMATSYEALCEIAPSVACGGGYNVLHINHPKHPVAMQSTSLLFHFDDDDDDDGDDDDDVFAMNRIGRVHHDHHRLQHNNDQDSTSQYSPDGDTTFRNLHLRHLSSNLPKDFSYSPSLQNTSTTVAHHHKIEMLSLPILTQLLSYRPHLYNNSGQTPIHQAIIMKLPSRCLSPLLSYFPVNVLDHADQQAFLLFINQLIEDSNYFYHSFPTVKHIIGMFLMAGVNVHTTPRSNPNRSSADVLLDTLSPQKPLLYKVIDECTLFAVLHSLGDMVEYSQDRLLSSSSVPTTTTTTQAAIQKDHGIPQNIISLLREFNASPLKSITRFQPSYCIAKGSAHTLRPPPLPSLVLGPQGKQANGNTIWHLVFMYIDKMTCRSAQSWLLLHLRLALFQHWNAQRTRICSVGHPTTTTTSRTNPLHPLSDEDDDDGVLDALSAYGYRSLLSTLLTEKNVSGRYPFQCFSCDGPLQWTPVTTNNEHAVRRQMDDLTKEKKRFHDEENTYYLQRSQPCWCPSSEQMKYYEEKRKQRQRYKLKKQKKRRQQLQQQHQESKKHTTHTNGKQTPPTTTTAPSTCDAPSLPSLPFTPSVFKAIIQTYISWLVPPEFPVFDPMLQREVPFYVYAVRYYTLLPINPLFIPHGPPFDIPSVNPLTLSTSPLLNSLKRWNPSIIDADATVSEVAPHSSIADLHSAHPLTPATSMLAYYLGGSPRISLPFDVDESALASLVNDAMVYPPESSCSLMKRGLYKNSYMYNKYMIRKQALWRNHLLEGVTSYLTFSTMWMLVPPTPIKHAPSLQIAPRCMDDLSQVVKHLITSTVCPFKLYMILCFAKAHGLLPPLTFLYQVIFHTQWDSYMMHVYEHTLTNEPNYSGTDMRAVKNAVLEMKIDETLFSMLIHGRWSVDEDDPRLISSRNPCVGAALLRLVTFLQGIEIEQHQQQHQQQPQTTRSVTLLETHAVLQKTAIELLKCIHTFTSFATSSEVYCYVKSTPKGTPSSSSLSRPPVHNVNLLHLTPVSVSLMMNNNSRTQSFESYINPPPPPPIVDSFPSPLSQWCGGSSTRYHRSESSCTNFYPENLCVPLTGIITKVLQSTPSSLVAPSSTSPSHNQHNPGNHQHGRIPIYYLLKMVADPNIIVHFHTCRSPHAYNPPPHISNLVTGQQPSGIEHNEPSTVYDPTIGYPIMEIIKQVGEYRTFHSTNGYTNIANNTTSNNNGSLYPTTQFALTLAQGNPDMYVGPSIWVPHQLDTVVFTSLQRQLATVLWKLHVTSQLYMGIDNILQQAGSPSLLEDPATEVLDMACDKSKSSIESSQVKSREKDGVEVLMSHLQPLADSVARHPNPSTATTSSTQTTQSHIVCNPQPWVTSPSLVFLMSFLTRQITSHEPNCNIRQSNSRIISTPNHMPTPCQLHVRTPFIHDDPHSPNPYFQHNYPTIFLHVLRCECFRAWFMTLDILSCVTPPYSSTMASPGHGRGQAPISSQTTSYLHPIAHNLAFFSIHFTQGSYNVLYSQLPTQMGGMAPNQNVDFRQLARTLYGYIDQTLFSWFNTVYSALIPCSADYIPLTWWFCNELISLSINLGDDSHAPLIAYMTHFSEWYALKQYFASQPSQDDHAIPSPTPTVQAFQRHFWPVPMSVLRPFVPQSVELNWNIAYQRPWSGYIPLFTQWNEYDDQLTGQSQAQAQAQEQAHAHAQTGQGNSDVSGCGSNIHNSTDPYNDSHYAQQHNTMIQSVNVVLKKLRRGLCEYVDQCGSLIMAAAGRIERRRTFSWLYHYGFAFASVKNPYQRALLPQFAQDMPLDPDSVILGTIYPPRAQVATTDFDQPDQMQQHNLQCNGVPTREEMENNAHEQEIYASITNTYREYVVQKLHPFYKSEDLICHVAYQLSEHFDQQPAGRPIAANPSQPNGSIMTTPPFRDLTGIIDTFYIFTTRQPAFIYRPPMEMAPAWPTNRLNQLIKFARTFLALVRCIQSFHAFISRSCLDEHEHEKVRASLGSQSLESWLHFILSHREKNIILYALGRGLDALRSPPIPVMGQDNAPSDGVLGKSNCEIEMDSSASLKALLEIVSMHYVRQE